MTYSYDANGNLTGTSAGLALGYNAKNQTTSAAPPGGSALALGYTGDGQTSRVQAGGASFVNTLLGLSSATEGGATTYYTRDHRGTLVGQRTPGGRYYYLFDALGSVLAVTDQGGAVANRYTPRQRFLDACLHCRVAENGGTPARNSVVSTRFL